MTYRPSGRSNRSGRSQAENDVFEGLPVKQWGQSIARVSLVPPLPEVPNSLDDKWGELPMPRDCQQLSPWTQQLLRLARNGKHGTKRKQDFDNADETNKDDETAENGTALDSEDRGYLIKKWKPVPESLLEPEHKHFEFLAKRRRGMPNIYGPGGREVVNVPTRKTRVRRVNPDGGVFVYEVLAPEGQSVEGELPGTLTAEEVAALPPSVVLGVGTVIEGLGVANEEGIVVLDALRPLGAARRNRSSTKKKGGPGRGKKRVTFTNPDGSTYTTVVPNATKIVPQPGQTVKHVAKGEIATADISKEEAARIAAERGEGQTPGDDDDDGEDDDDDDEDDEGDDDDDDDREDGELSDEETSTARATPLAGPVIQALANETASVTSTASQPPDTTPVGPVADLINEETGSGLPSTNGTPLQEQEVADGQEDVVMEEAPRDPADVDIGTTTNEPHPDTTTFTQSIIETTALPPVPAQVDDVPPQPETAITEVITDSVEPTPVFSESSGVQDNIGHSALPVTEPIASEVTVTPNEGFENATLGDRLPEVVQEILPTSEPAQIDENELTAATDVSSVNATTEPSRRAPSAELEPDVENQAADESAQDAVE